MKQAFTIQSDLKGEAGQQVLSVRIGEHHFGYAITGSNGNQLFQLGWYTNEDIEEQTLQEIYLREPALQQPYARVNLCYDHPQSILVPLQHFKEDDTKLLLRSMFGVNGGDTIFTEKVGDWQLNNVFAIPARIHQWAREHFIKGHYWHSYTIGVRNIESTNFEGALVVDFRNDDFSIIASRGNKLLLTQTFLYSNPADVIYYLLKTCQEFSFSQETVRLSLSGLVDKESALYRDIYQYFIHVRFREPSWTVPATDETSYPSHFFTSLNDLARCES